MSSYKVDYSELVTALQEDDLERANEVLKELLPRLQTYVVVTLGATRADAEEAVHRAMARVYATVMDDQINNKKAIYKYLMKSCRHAYLNMFKKRAQHVEHKETYQLAPPRQIENLLDEDRQRILKECLQKLPEKSRSYITYIMNHPEVSTRSLSKHFNLSDSNVRVKKSRIIHTLSDCVNKNMDK